jgi:hypothetical protein
MKRREFFHTSAVTGAPALNPFPNRLSAGATPKAASRAELADIVKKIPAAAVRG